MRTTDEVFHALEKIKRQGEGSQFSPADSNVHDLSHYYRFKEMRVGRRYRFDAARAQWDWAEPIDVPVGDFLGLVHCLRQWEGPAHSAGVNGVVRF